MVEWISETFSLLFGGINQLFIAAMRLGLVFVALVVVWAYIRALTKNPVVVLRGTVAIIAMFLIGFGSIFFVPKYVNVPVIIIWIAGWVAAFYVAVLIGGWRDEKKPNEPERNDFQ